MHVPHGEVMLVRGHVAQIEPPRERWCHLTGERRQTILVREHGYFEVSTRWIRFPELLPCGRAWLVDTTVRAVGCQPRGAIAVRLPEVTDHEMAITALLDQLNEKSSHA